MQNEQSLEESQELYGAIKELIDTLEESPDNKSQISGILTLLKTITGQLESNDEIRLYQNELIEKHSEMLNYAKNTAQIQDDSLKASVKVFTEFDERITKLEKLVTDIATNSAQLARKVQELAENAAKIPVINIDNLLKKLNEHSDEINENAASIKAIKDKLEN